MAKLRKEIDMMLLLKEIKSILEEALNKLNEAIEKYENGVKRGLK